MTRTNTYVRCGAGRGGGAQRARNGSQVVSGVTDTKRQKTVKYTRNESESRRDAGGTALHCTAQHTALQRRNERASDQHYTTACTCFKNLDTTRSHTPCLYRSLYKSNPPVCTGTALGCASTGPPQNTVTSPAEVGLGSPPTNDPPHPPLFELSSSLLLSTRTTPVNSVKTTLTSRQGGEHTVCLECSGSTTQLLGEP